MTPKTTILNRFGGTEDNKANLLSALVVLIQRSGGRVTLSRAELDQINGGLGLRARYEQDGGFTLWTYDLVEDLKGILGEHGY